MTEASPAIPEPDLLVPVGEGRRLALDDRGDAAGVPVLYLHGCPDSRLARHPDESLAVAARVRLLAADRPGIGGSDPHPGADVDAVVTDLLAALDHLGLDRVAVLGWSAGCLPAAHLAAVAPHRVSALALACPAVPPIAGCDAAVAGAAGPDRLGMWEAAAEWGAAEMAADAVEFLLPHPITWDAAMAHAGHGDPVRAREVAAVEGALEQMAGSAMATVHRGLDGLRDELARLLTDPGTDYGRITAPTRIWVGTEDGVTPPAFAHWYAGRIGTAVVEEHPDHSHALALIEWEGILRWCVEETTGAAGSDTAAEASHGASEPTT